MSLFSVFSKLFDIQAPDSVSIALCRALPVLAAWDTYAFVSGGQATQIFDFICAICKQRRDLLSVSLRSLGQLANTLIDDYEPYLAQTNDMVLDILRAPHTQAE